MAVTPISLTPGVLAEAVVDLGAIAHNVRVLREHAGGARVMAVVKANGYGHGATRVARTALAAGAAELGVATVDEALALRADGITRRCWRGCTRRASTSGRRCWPMWRSRCPRCASSTRCWTRCVAPGNGDRDRQGRHGAEPQRRRPGALPRHADRIAPSGRRGRHPAGGLMSHMVFADQPDNPINDVQAQRFRDMLAQARDVGLRFEVVHLANSSATMSRPDLAFDLVRPGSPCTV